MITFGIISYGCGNLYNLAKAFARLSVTYRLVEHPEEAGECDTLILPGVGSFKRGMSHLVASGMDDAVRDFSASGRVLLGICLGMQLLLSSSEEFGHSAGLGLLEGDIKNLSCIVGRECRIPHVGWAPVVSCGKVPSLFSGLPQPLYCYFSHSFALPTVQVGAACCLTPFHDQWFVSALEHENIIGLQFHPELSGAIGLSLLRNVIAKCE